MEQNHTTFSRNCRVNLRDSNKKISGNKSKSTNFKISLHSYWDDIQSDLGENSQAVIVAVSCFIQSLAMLLTFCLRPDCKQLFRGGWGFFSTFSSFFLLVGICCDSKVF